MHRLRGNFDGAERLLLRALEIRESGEDAAATAEMLTVVGNFFFASGRYERSLEYLARSLLLHEHLLGPGHLQVADVLHSYALVLRRNGSYEAAERHLLRALSIQEQHLGPASPHLTHVMHALALTYILSDRPFDAQPFVARALSLNRAAWGQQHSLYAASLNLFCLLLQSFNMLSEAESVIRRVLLVREKTLGMEHVRWPPR